MQWNGTYNSKFLLQKKYINKDIKRYQTIKT